MRSVHWWSTPWGSILWALLLQPKRRSKGKPASWYGRCVCVCCPPFFFWGGEGTIRFSFLQLAWPCETFGSRGPLTPRGPTSQTTRLANRVVHAVYRAASDQVSLQHCRYVRVDAIHPLVSVVRHVIPPHVWQHLPFAVSGAIKKNLPVVTTSKIKGS